MQLNATINWHQCGSMLFKPAYIEMNMNVRREDEKSVHQCIHTDTEPQSHRQTTTTTKIDSMKTNWLFASLMACHEYKFYCNNLSASSWSLNWCGSIYLIVGSITAMERGKKCEGTTRDKRRMKKEKGTKRAHWIIWQNHYRENKTKNGLQLIMDAWDVFYPKGCANKTTTRRKKNTSFEKMNDKKVLCLHICYNFCFLHLF